MDIGRFVEWDNFLFINQNYKQGFQQVRTVVIQARFVDFMQKYSGYKTMNEFQQVRTGFNKFERV